MPKTTPESAPFATARCPTCACQRPAYDRLAEDGSIQQACLVCDTPLIVTDYCSLDELSGLGYGVVEEPRAGGGCGCAAGGCSHKSKPN